MRKHHQSRLRWMIWSAIAMLAVVLPVGLWGCAATIVPEAQLDEPVTVYVFDYGRHSSLVLPIHADDDADNDHSRYGYIEYAYGEWRWFAKNEAGPFGALRALFVPSQGTLGRRSLAHSAPESMIRQHAIVALHEFDVERRSADSLRRRLANEWNANRDSQVYNERYGLHFVHHDKPYTFFNNCNPMLAHWIEQLDCEVRGWALFSNWRVRQPDHVDLAAAGNDQP